ncbi:uncharacterized protein LOC119673429 [Teleopsis dalmanni]|nr:uncharacterized protein LOC119673429 [Teleopsis dalmanni]
MKRKESKGSGNNNATHSLNRGDSQRTPSMLTAVTQIDSNGRQIRTFRQPSYYRTNSNGSSSYKEHVSLLQVSPTPSIMRKSTLVRSPHPNQATHLLAHHTHSTNFIDNSNGGISPPHSTILLSYDNHRGGVATTMKAHSNHSLSNPTTNVGTNLLSKNPLTGNAMNASYGLHGLIDESVSSV